MNVDVAADELPHCLHALDVFFQSLASDLDLHRAETLGQIPADIGQQFVQREL